MAKPRYFNLSIANLRNRLRLFKPVLTDRFINLVAENEKSIIQLITEDQLFDRGEDGRGISLGSYTLGTIKHKKRKNQPTNRITLKDSGDFYRALAMVVTEEGFYIEYDKNKSNEPTDTFYDKRDSLRKRYPYALRLSNENLKDIINTIIKPQLIEWMRSYLLEERLTTGDVTRYNKFNKRFPKKPKWRSNRR